IALSICVLSGCRTSSDSKYYLYSANGTNITRVMGRNCTSCNFDAVPVSYMFGMSGLCRSTKGTTNCQRQFPHSFNLTSTTLADISVLNTTNASTTPSQQYQDYTGTTSINHGLVHRLSTAVSALLILSVILSFLFIPLSIVLESAFSRILLIFLLFDACALLSALCMFYSIFRNEIAPAYEAAPEIKTKDWPVNFGLGAWMLVGAFGCRLLSNPILFIGFVGLLLAVVLLPIALLLMCCGAGSATYQVVLVPVTYFYV
ncbi:hypothetical protein K469DRAFT_592335, partial [Zopfia rhizophila CBS 207.26]